MTDLTPVIFRRTLLKLVEFPSETNGMRAWLLSGAYSIDSGAGAGEFALTNVDGDEFLGHHIYDYRRFAFASIESFSASGVKYFDPKALGWPFVKLYYAAFFAAHALMRAVGEAVIHVETEAAKHLTELGRLVIGPQFNVQGGTYHLRTEAPLSYATRIEFRRLGDGGAHEVLWETFRLFLSQLAEVASANNEPNAGAIVGRIDEVQRILCAAGLNRGSWLSSMRNKINYQHDFGLWFPFQGQAKQLGHKLRIKLKNNAAIRLDYQAGKSPIDAFIAATTFLVAINHDLSTQMVLRAQSKKLVFGREWDRLIRDATVK